MIRYKVSVQNWMAAFRILYLTGAEEDQHVSEFLETKQDSGVKFGSLYLRKYEIDFKLVWFYD